MELTSISFTYEELESLDYALLLATNELLKRDDETKAFKMENLRLQVKESMKEHRKCCPNLLMDELNGRR